MYANPTRSPETEQPPEEVLEPSEVAAEPRKTRGKWLKLGLRMGVTIAIFAFLLKSVSWSTLFSTLVHAHHAALLMGLGIGVLCVVFSAYSWQVLLKAEYISADLAQLINLYLVGIAFSHFLPSSMGGDVVKAYYTGRDSGRMAGATGAVILSRITGFMGMLLIALPALYIWNRQFNVKMVVSFLLVSFLLVAMVAGAMVISTQLPKMSRRFAGRQWFNHRIVATVIEVGQTLSKGVRRPQALSMATVFSLLFWLASFLNYYGYATALRMQVPFPFYIIAISFASIVAFFPISINGFGVREGVLVYAFSTVHVAPSTSLLLAFLMDIQVLLFGLIGGCIYLAMGTKQHKRM